MLLQDLQERTSNLSENRCRINIAIVAWECERINKYPNATRDLSYLRLSSKLYVFKKEITRNKIHLIQANVAVITGTEKSNPLLKLKIWS